MNQTSVHKKGTRIAFSEFIHFQSASTYKFDVHPPLSRYLLTLITNPPFSRSLIARLTVLRDSFMSEHIVEIAGKHESLL